MKNAIQWVRSLLFIIQMYVVLAVIGFGMVPMVWLNRKYAFVAIHAYCNWVRWTASWMVGLKSEIRGEVPQGEVLVAAKHQSFFDILLLASVLPRLKFIYKKQLKWAPVIGIYAVYTNSVPVDRGKRGAAIKQMVAEVRDGRVEPGQLVIFPQGTRVAAGAKKPYKVGTGVLYKETGQPVVPAATNVGVFWKRHGIMRYPGLAVLEFLPAIEPGQEIGAFMKRVEEDVETTSDRLMQEAGFTPDI
ncbi:lysophospholipid acyltransferase family protein [Aliiroseovarius lamellibrachiae]|uniref:lysophospholipid acyltransferase family protein n=1 Tax=Aliiroseovarius lamellibrachiae TaxID=1924933 RepID=UPI001BE03744|nr:lysophospholipid acyltransferase family protein [Aliiroseovarius lamellibrachiae]MBT2130148.1 1-acyl-sn-glycerol-3-phosphate acyltransferase [Aliiroseovarius lamellibrachiae]